MARFSDQLKATYEYQTLAFFVRFVGEDDGPDYEVLRFQERPDAVLRRAGDSAEIGAEITRIVTADDAIIRRAMYQMGQGFVEKLSSASPGGYMELHAGECPELSDGGVERVLSAFDAAAEAAGGIRAFVEGLRGGFWDYERTRFYFELKEEGDWQTGTNAVSLPLRKEVERPELEALLLDRVRSKVSKAPAYPWDGPLLLVIRNTYQAITPSDVVLDEAASLAGGVFAEAWLVNHREGVLDLSPPKPRLIRLA